MKVEGGCHCGLVRFEAEVPAGRIEARECDCSWCRMNGYRHLVVPEADFRQTEGVRDITAYRFGSGRARHLFCTQCGIESFHRPAEPPRAISINLRCLDEDNGLDVRVSPLHDPDHPAAG